MSMGFGVIASAKTTEKGQTKFDFSRVMVSNVSAGTYAIVGEGNSANAGGTTFAVLITEEAGGGSAGGGDVTTCSDKGINWYYKSYKLPHDASKVFLDVWSNALTQNSYNAAITSAGAAAAINEVGSKMAGGLSILNGLIIATELYVKSDLFNQVSNNYDGSGLSIETWTTRNGSFSFPITISYIKRNSDGKSIGILWH